MRLLVDSEFRIAGGIVGTGFDEFRWITPVRPGDTLHLETEVVDVRRSTRKPTQSLVKVRITTLNQNMEPVQILLANLAVPSRSASSTPCERELNKGNTTMAAIEQIDELKNQALTQQEAAAILARYQELWNRGALPELLEGFTDDITVEFADLPTIKGKRELGQIIRARLARQMHYRLKKTLRFVSGNTIVGSWVADWTDGATGRPMKGKGIEFIEMRDGKCARWEATFNAWDAEAPSRSQFT